MTAPVWNDDTLLTWTQLAPHVPLTCQRASQLEKEGKFPSRLQVSENRVAWRYGDIKEWIANLPRGPMELNRIGDSLARQKAQS